MEKSIVNMWLTVNAENFSPEDRLQVKTTLEGLDEDKLLYLQGAGFQSPSTILLIAVFLGWERFFLGDTVMGILKLITCYGCLIWWLVDIFSARKRAQKYNLKRFIQYTNIA